MNTIDLTIILLVLFFPEGELGGSPAPDATINSSADKENTNNSDDNNNSSLQQQQQSQQLGGSSSQSSLHRVGEAGKIHKSSNRHKKGKNKSKHR